VYGKFLHHMKIVMNADRSASPVKRSSSARFAIVWVGFANGEIAVAPLTAGITKKKGPPRGGPFL
jgi:hypothetical protein